MLFPNMGHAPILDQGWEQVAVHIVSWIGISSL